MSSEPIYKGMEIFSNKFSEMQKNDELMDNAVVNNYLTVIKSLTELSNAEKAEILVHLYRNINNDKDVKAIRENIIEIFNALQFKNLENETDNRLILMLNNIDDAYKEDHSQQNGFLSAEIKNNFRQILRLDTPTDNSDATQDNAPTNEIELPPPPTRTPPLPSFLQTPQSTPKPIVQPSHVTASHSASTTQYNNPIVKWLAQRLGDNYYGNLGGQRNVATSRVFVSSGDLKAMPDEDFGSIAKDQILDSKEIVNQLKTSQRSTEAGKAEFTQETARYAMKLFDDLKKDIFDKEFEEFLSSKAMKDGIPPNKDPIPLEKDEIERIKREISASYFMATINQIFPTKGEMSDNERNYNYSMQRLMMIAQGQFQKNDFASHEQLYNSVLSKLEEGFKPAAQATLDNYTTNQHPFESIKKNVKEYHALGDRAHEIMQDMINRLPVSVKKIQLQKEFNQSILGEDTAAIKQANLELQSKISSMTAISERIQLQREMNQQLWGNNSKTAQQVNGFLQDKIRELNPSLETIKLQKEFNDQILGQESDAPNRGNEHLQKQISELPPSLNKIRLQYEINTQLMGATSLRDKFTSALSSVVGVLRERVTGNKSEGTSETAPSSPTGTTTASSTGGTSENQSKKSTASSFWGKLFERAKKETPTVPVTDLANLYASTSPKESAAPQTPKDTNNRLDANKKNKWHEKDFTQSPDTKELQDKLYRFKSDFMEELKDIIDPQTGFTLHRAIETIKEILPSVESIRTAHPGENNQKLITNTLQALAQELSNAIKIEEEVCRKTTGVDQSGKLKQESDKLTALREVNKLLEDHGTPASRLEIAATATKPPTTQAAAKSSGPIETVRNNLRL